MPSVKYIIMPSLIDQGPDMPEEVLQSLADEKLVLFCGAGISIPTGLPNYEGLVKEIHNKLIPGKVFSKKPGDLDRYLFKLEKRFDKSRFREAVSKSLTAELSGENTLRVHRAILTLSRIESDGYRLVTTNFDDRFDLAADEEKVTPKLEVAPCLSVPKPNRWKSLVYLHGKLDGNFNEPEDLILTSADYGRAYLTERWASRFITELLRNFEILIIGYGADEPVINYFFDAVHAEEKESHEYRKVWALVPLEDKGKWERKGVQPIPYNKKRGGRDKYVLLNETLIKWAEDKKNPLASRTRYAVDNLTKMPTDEEGDIAKRVVWALRDAKTISVVSRCVLFENPANYVKFRRWLDIFKDAELFNVQSNHLGDRNNPQRLTSIVGNWHSGVGSPIRLTDEVWNLSSWLAKHIHVPVLLEWVVEQGGMLHPEFIKHILSRLDEYSERGKRDSLPETSDKLLNQWMLLCTKGQDLQDRRSSYMSSFLGDLRKGSAFKAAMTSFLNLLEPRLVPELIPPRPVEEIQSESQQARISFKVECGIRVDVERYMNFFNNESDLADHAYMVTGMLIRTLKLFQEIKMDSSSTDCYDPSYINRPSISDHSQNNNSQSYTALIILARDADFQLAKINHSAVRVLRRIWLTQPYPTFKRLFLHAITEDKEVSVHKAIDLLLKDNNLWEQRLLREAMRFLRKCGPRISERDQKRLTKFILKGPPRKMYRSDFSDEDFQRLSDRRIWRVLVKLHNSGIKFSQADKCSLDELSSKYSQELASDDEDEFPFWSEAGSTGLLPAEEDEKEKMLERLRKADAEGGVALSNLLKESLEGRGKREALLDFFREREMSFMKAYKYLADDRNWSEKAWNILLSGISNHLFVTSSGEDENPLNILMDLLLDLPDELLHENCLSIAHCLDKNHGMVKGNDKYKKIWLKLWEKISSDTSESSSIISIFNTVPGMLATLALKDLWDKQPKEDSKIPASLRDQFSRMVEDGNPNYIHARVVLSTYLNNLFLIDSKWCTKNLLKKMTLNDSDPSSESLKLWSGFSWSPVISPGLAKSFKKDFLKVFSHPEVENYSVMVRALSYVCSEFPKIFGASEVDHAISNIDFEMRAELINYFSEGAIVSKKSAKKDLEIQGAIWKEKVRPFLEHYWQPKTGERNKSTYRAFALLAIRSGSEFGDAWSLIKHHVGTFDHVSSITSELEKTPENDNLCSKHPEEILELLSKIFTDETPDWDRHKLKECLDKIKEAKPELENSAKFQKLHRFELNSNLISGL